MKRSTTLLLAGAMTVFLSACGKGPEPRPEVRKEPAAASVVETKDNKSEESKPDAALGDRADSGMESPMDPAPPADGNTETPPPAPGEGQQ